MEKLIILWLDDQREPYSYFKKVRPKSKTWIRNNEFYQNNIFNRYDVEFVWVKNIDEFINYIETNGLPKFISFDFDLKNGRMNTDGPVPNGGDCAQWLIKYCKDNGLQLPKCYSHTANKTQRPLLNNILGLSENRHIIKLTESELKQIVTEVIEKILKKAVI